MKKIIYEAPQTDVILFSVEANFATSGEQVSIVSGFDWDDEE